MRIGIFQYKCLQCGKVENGGRTGEQHVKQKLESLLMGIKTDPLLYESYSHNCDESRMGIMQLVGYKVEDE